MPVSVHIEVNLGTAVTVFAQFSKPTRSSYPTVKLVPADPLTVKYQWGWYGGTLTTWVFTVGGGAITRLATGLYVATIPTRTPKTSNVQKILGIVSGLTVVTATAPFTFDVETLTA